MTVVGQATLQLQGDSAQFISAMNRAGKRFEQVANRMQSVGASLTQNLTLPIVGLGVAATKAAADFESSFAGIRKTMDLTEEQFDTLARANRQLARTIPVNVNEINRIGELAGQLGVRGVGNVLKFEDTIAKLAVTTDLSADSAALALAQFTNIMQLPQSQIDRLGASIVGLGNNFATTESRVVDFAQRIGGAGKLAGLTAGQVFGIGTAFASVGLEAEAGGTAIQQVLLDLRAAVDLGGDKLREFARTAGLSASDFQKLFEEDAGEAFVRFVEGLASQGNRAIGTLQELGLANQRTQRAFLSAAGAGDVLRRAMQLGVDEFEKNTALTEEAEKRFKTFHSQLTLTWNRIKDIAITMGQALIPVFQDALDVAEPLFDIFEGAAKRFSALEPATRRLAISFAAAAAAAGPMLNIFGRVLSTLSMLLNPWVALTAAFVGAIVAIRNNWLGMGDAAVRVWGTITNVVGTAVSAILGAVRPWINLLIGYFVALGNIGKIVWDEYIREPALAAFRKIREWGEKVFSAIAAGLEYLGKLGKGAAEAIRNFFTDAAEGAEEEGATIGQRVAAAIVDAFSADYVGAFGDVVQAGIDRVKGVLLRAIEFLKSLRAQGGAEQIVLDLEDIVTELDNATAGVTALTEEGFKLRDFADTIESIAEGFTDTLGDALATGKFQFREFVDFALREIARLAARLLVFKGLMAIFGGPALSSVFGESLLGFEIPGRASGGPIRPNQPYLVGERGPELIVPKSAGNVIANDRLMGGGVLRLDASSLPERPRAVTPDALAMDDWWRRAFSSLYLDRVDRGGQ